MKASIPQTLIATALALNTGVLFAQGQEANVEKAPAEKAKRLEEKQTQGRPTEENVKTRGDATGSQAEVPGETKPAESATSTPNAPKDAKQGDKKESSTNLQTGPNAARDTKTRTQNDAEAGRASADAPSGTHPTTDGPKAAKPSDDQRNRESDRSKAESTGNSDEGKTPSGPNGRKPNNSAEGANSDSNRATTHPSNPDGRDMRNTPSEPARRNN